MLASTYPSKFTDKQVTPEQYLAEVVLERHYKSENPGKDPSYKFWKEPVWEKRFVQQCVIMSRLKKLGITPKAVSAALKTQRGKTCFSLGAPWLKSLALIEQRKLNLMEKRIKQTPLPAPIDESVPLNRPAQISDKKSKLELLEE